MIEKGQVLTGSPFGNVIFDIASNPILHTFVEVGTWKGFGTTRCVMQGLIKRFQEEGSQDVHFYSFESNETFYKEALTLWNQFAYPCLHLCYGKLHRDGLLSKEDIESHPYFPAVKTHYDLWYEQDKLDYEESPFSDPMYLPKTIDVLILDGGEFSGYADWEALKQKRPLFVCLDDIYTMKNERVFKELSENKEEWESFAEGQDRHGWAIFCRRNLSR